MLEFCAVVACFAPLISFIFSGVFGRCVSSLVSSTVCTTLIVFSAIASCIVFNEAIVKIVTLDIFLFNWISIDALAVNFNIYIDKVSALMLFLVTLVSAVVHIYSIFYNLHGYSLIRFLGFLSLFTFFMIVLIVASNFVQLFLGWEGVGLCSYFLIGYYFRKDSANLASMKSFIVNRISDCALIVGIVLIYVYFGSVDFASVFSQVENVSSFILCRGAFCFKIIDLIALLLFIGCIGKSAQIGLHVWLPDAMEGPTPVSALIHAATMVTAGVFLLVRCSFIFEYSDNILSFISFIGAFTAFICAFIALTQSDIKKIIAYSTCSQLGYMVMACGVSSYQSAIFHLATHAFFKALLFLCAGNVIQACGQQNIFKLGRLYNKLPITCVYFIIGSLAISGIFPFSGFYSKDAIIESVYLSSGGDSVLFIMSIVSTFLTSCYSFKLLSVVFYGAENCVFPKLSIHDDWSVKNLVLVILLFGALFFGMIGQYLLNFLGQYGYFYGNILNLKDVSFSDNVPFHIQILPILFSVLGICFSIYFYGIKKIQEGFFENKFKRIAVLFYISKNKFFFDKVYDVIFVRGLKSISNLSIYIDNKYDTLVCNLVKKLTDLIGYVICVVNNGYIHKSSSFMMGCLVLVMCFISVGIYFSLF